MKEFFRQYFALDIQPDQLPTNHGATLVANTAFATVGVIGVILLIPSIILGEHPLVVGALLLGIIGALNGYLLWKRGYIVLSTTLHAGGLVFIGSLTFLATQTIGGATGILYLASVITAGGFLGIRGAIIDIIAVLISGLFIIFLGDFVRPMFALPVAPFVPPEIIVQLFVFLSIPAWGAYVVAVTYLTAKPGGTFQTKQRLEKQTTAISTATGESS